MQLPRTAFPLVVCAAALVAGCGSTRSSATPANTVPQSASGTLKVSPARPLVRSPIGFSFTAPVSSGVHGKDVIGYSLSITGPGAPGCVGAHEAAPGRARKGATTTTTVGPAQLGRPWCPGRYSARVIELQRPHCAAQAPCPQFIRVVAIVARATFEVRRA
jgi:hypothetical protein